MIDSLDITFCRGEVKYSDNGVDMTIICPVREKCHRYWTKEHSEIALKTGDIYHSFFIMDDPSVITAEGCDNFWRD